MTSAMLYNYIKTHYKQAEPIFLSDLLRTNITEPDLNQQLKELCEKGLLQQYDEEDISFLRRPH